MNWMVVRQAFGGEYWEYSTYGPMSAEEADRLISSEYGGFKLTCTQFTEQGYR